jgi:hypothetical protein
MPDVGHVIDVIDRSGHVEGLRHSARLRSHDDKDEPPPLCVSSPV